MARPFSGFVSHTAPSLQGLLTHASSRWHSKPEVEAWGQNPCQLPNNSAARNKRDILTNPLTRLSNWALAEEGSYTVMAGGTVEADGYGTVIDVLAAVVSSPTINADTGMAPDGVEACAPVMTGVWLHETLVDVLSTVLPWSCNMTNNVRQTYHRTFMFKFI